MQGWRREVTRTRLAGGLGLGRCLRSGWDATHEHLTRGPGWMSKDWRMKSERNDADVQSAQRSRWPQYVVGATHASPLRSPAQGDGCSSGVKWPWPLPPDSTRPGPPRPTPQPRQGPPPATAAASRIRAGQMPRGRGRNRPPNGLRSSRPDRRGRREAGRRRRR